MDRRLPLLSCLLALTCARPPLQAVLDVAGGLEPHSRVYAAGVEVGRVASVAVDGTHALVRFTLLPGQALSLREDACAMSLPEPDGALLLLFPGKALEPLAPRAVPECESGAAQLASLQQLARSGGGALSQAIHRFLEAPPRPSRTAPLDQPCEALTVSRLRLEPVEALPELLPSGGKRLWLKVENHGTNTVSLATATFLDARGAVAAQTRMLEGADLLTAVSIPPGDRREVSAVFAGSRGNQVSAVEVEASFPDAAPGAACRVRWRL